MSKLKNSVLKEYTNLYDQYYYAMIIFNSIIVKKLEDQHEYSLNQFLRLKLYFKKMNLIRRLLYIGASIFIWIINWEKCLIIDLNSRFNYLNSNIVSAFEEKKYKVVDFNKKKLIDRIFKFYLYNCKQNIGKILENYQYEDLGKLFENNDLMNQINDQVKKYIIKIQRRLIKHKVKLNISTDDFSLYKSLLQVATKNVGLSSFSIPHGYPQTKFYHPFYYSDQILFWNYSQYKQFKDHIDNNHVLIFGYPKYDKKYIMINSNYKTNANVITLVTTPSQSLEEKIKIMEELKFLILEGYKVNVRLHPKEFNTTKNSLLLKYIADNDFKLSQKPLLFDIFSSYFVIGRITSVIYEAHVLNSNALQIDIQENNEDVRYEIPTIKISQIKKLSCKSFVNQKLDKSRNSDLINNFQNKINDFFSYYLSN